MYLQAAYWGDFLVEADAGKLMILAYEGDLEKVRIPSVIEGFPVERIARRAFDNEFATRLKRVELPSSLVTFGKIEENAFPEDVVTECYVNSNIDGFEHDGMWITNPYYDETGRFRVDPLKYYGLNLDKSS